MSDAEIGAVYAAIETTMPHEALREIAPGELERVAKAAIAASSSVNWRRRAERMADMHRDMCVVAGTFQSEAERLSGEFLSLRRAAERVCWFDWSGNDPDAVQAVEELRRTLGDQP